MIKVLLADNQLLTFTGLSTIFRESRDITVVAQVSKRDDFESQLKTHQPHVLVVDPGLRDYLTKEDLQIVKDCSPDTNTLVISSDQNKENILDILQQGVIGYLTKECSRDEIIRAVNAVARGEKFFCPTILDVIMEKHFQPTLDNTPNGLTAREKEILALLASGNSTQNIADQLHLSPHTVHTHRKSIIRKLGIKSPTEFVIYAWDLGLIKTGRL